ncbi:peptide-modifying radical SAM enzyme CbpB [Candidatus Methanoliparum sp. LAM-1]|uniref:peptide-modifying radical SAM enzyme CbpB n=1 Tax=Candidatus Methanoliparum sp. LAM-1 TaxID=2874846 RepID=UPI001E543D8F|nr:peptide-modifying radical SAM enzyme CbpB [Candidatus Methanoliparum sp. LAM-1]BDC36317.1 peptide-modifying radical SAM enzyme CbpB [Candidatus Methanoliparum sp. LAM-1]
MLESFKVDDIEFNLDPDTCFWGIGEYPALEELYNKVREDITREMQNLRFNTDIILLYLNPTDRCNASCPYCYHFNDIKARGIDMSYNHIESIINKFIEYYDDKNIEGSVIFHGVEPLLLKDDIFKIIENYKNDVFFGIQTNGFLLNEEDTTFIKENDVKIGISLDSPYEKTDDFLRGKGHFKKINNVLDWFNGYKQLNINTTVTKHNVHQLSSMVNFLIEKEIHLCLMNPVRGTQKSALSFRPDPIILAKEYIDAVNLTLKSTKGGYRFVIGDFANILLGIVAPSSRVMLCDISPCGAARRFFAIAADGSAYPCSEFIGKEDFVGGNIYQNSINDICRSQNFEKVRERVVEKIDDCATCLIRNICGASCPSEIHSTDGSMYKKSFYCDFYKELIKHAFRVIYQDEVRYVLKQDVLKEMYYLR